jgi:hypothetical protein
MCAGDLQEDICEILVAGRKSWEKDGGRIIWQRLSVHSGQEMEY